MKDLKKVYMLVSFVDLTNFARNSEKMELMELAELVSDFYIIVEETIESGGGEVIKFIGDEALIVFSEEKADLGVKTLLACKQRTDKWLKDMELNSQLIVKAHFGEVVYGRFGKKMANPDIMGKNVNIAALIRSNGFAITPQAFRKLGAETRKLLKKHTPPVTYIPVSEYHKD